MAAARFVTCSISALFGLIYPGNLFLDKLTFFIFLAVLSAESFIAAKISYDFLELSLNLSARSTLSLLVARLSLPLEPACVKFIN